MRRTCAIALAIFMVLMGTQATAAVTPDSKPGSPGFCFLYPHDRNCRGVTASAGGSAIDLNGVEEASESSDGADLQGNKPASVPTVTVVHQYAPTCTGNTRFDVQVLCTAAVNTCRPANAGLVQYWKWTVTTELRTGVVTVVQEPGAVCLGPSDAVVSPVAAIGGVLARELQKLIVLKGTARVKPSGTTLVNYDTGFYTEAGRYVLNPVQILGHTVVVTAIPQSYDWHFGDGTSALEAGPGQPDDSDVRHTYRQSGSVAPYVVITWTGTFTVDGGGQQPEVGTAQTTGPGTPLQDKQARAELVTG